MNTVRKSINPALILCISFVLLFGAFSCTTSSSVERSMVQIWAAADVGEMGKEGGPLAYGVAVGDGSQILTVFNYEDDIPDNLVIGLPGKPKYHVSIQAVDPQYSITLLKIEDGVFPAVTAGKSELTNSGDRVTIHGWTGPVFNKIETTKTDFPGYNTPFMVDISPDHGYVGYDGAVVTGKNNEPIGLIGHFSNTFVIILGGPGLTPPIIDIQSGLNLLSLDSANKSWVKMPVYTLITDLASLTGAASNRMPAEKYGEMAAALEPLLGTMGAPLPANELPVNYRSISWGGLETVDGTLFTVVYPRPVELRNVSGDVSVKAKWVGLQWGMNEGKPNRIFYGHLNLGNAVIDGGFYLLGDISTLESTLH
jgi:hypothetical protein